MKEPNWAKLLKFFYEKDDQLHKYGGIKESLFEGWEHPIMKETGLSRNELYSGITTLENKGLIDRNSWGLYYLTDKGFEIAHDREIKKQQAISSEYVAIFTVVLAMTAFAELLSSVGLLSTNLEIFLTIIICLTIVVPLILMLSQHHSFLFRWRWNSFKMKIRELYASIKPKPNSNIRKRIEKLSED